MTTTTDEAPAFARLLRNYLASGESAHSLAMDKWAKTHGLLTQAATTIEQLQRENERLKELLGSVQIELANDEPGQSVRKSIDAFFENQQP